MFPHVFKDPLANLLESSVKQRVVLVTYIEIGFKFEFELLFHEFFYQNKEGVNKFQESNHLLLWLHWKFCIT